MDWRIAYDDSDDLAGGRLALVDIKFVLVSEAAGCMEHFLLSGMGLKLSVPKIPERVDKVIDWLKKWEGVERDKIFWPLTVFKSFCIHDLNWADGTAKVGSMHNEKVLYFNAFQGNIDKNPGNLAGHVPRVTGMLFEQSQNGQVLKDQPLDYGVTIVDGKWRLLDAAGKEVP